MRNFYIIIFIFTFFTAHAQKDFFKDEWVQRNFTKPATTMEYTDNASGNTVSVTVNVDDTTNKVLPTIFSNNLPAWRASLLYEKDIIDHIKRANFKTMRIPGGNWSSNWFWDGTNHWDGSNQDGYSGTLKDFDDTKNYLDVIKSRPTTKWSLTSDQMLTICKNWGAEPQICVNYALARYIDAPDAVQQAAHYAAEWVRHVKALGIKVKYWEIGNEHYGSWQSGYKVDGETLTGTEYGKDACVFIDSMKAADPTIKVGIGLNTGKEHWIPNFSVDAIKAAGDKADFIIIHDYFTWAKEPNDVTYSEILNAIPQIGSDYNLIQQRVNSYTSKDYMPVAMTEYHYVAGLKETEGIATLFFAHALGEYITKNYGLVNYWDIQNGSGADDHGMFTYGESGVDDNIPHPSFFPYYFYNKMFGDVLTPSTCDNDSVFVYSSRFSNDYAGVVVINQTESQKSVTIDIPGYSISDTVYRYELSTDALSSRKIYINGETSDDGELYAPRDYETIAPYMQTVTDNAIKTGIREYSVNYFVVGLKNYTSVQKAKRASDFSLAISPNPSKGIVNVSYSLSEEGRTRLDLYNYTGQLVKVLLEENGTPGKHNRRFDLSSLKPGIYILRLSGDHGSGSAKLIIRH
jgi:hypothetical protein